MRPARFAIRRAGPSDAPQAARIVRDALAEHGLPFEPDGRDADLALFGARPDHDDFVAEIDERAVGVVSVGPHGAPGVAWVSKLFVSPEGRRQGIGRALMIAAEDAARRRGYAEIGLRTRVVFRAANALYRALGYAPRPAELEPGEFVYFRAL